MLIILNLSAIAFNILFPLTQNPLTVAPHAYKLQFENDWVRVVRVRYEPRQMIPSHDHPRRGTVYVYLSDSGPVRFIHTGEEKFTVDRPALKTGGFRLGRAVIETHEVNNLSDQPSDFLRVELKTIPVDSKSFRGRYPPDAHSTNRSSQKVRFENGQVRITRVTCAIGKGTEQAIRTARPSVMVLLTPGRFAMVRNKVHVEEQRLALGDTIWIEADEQLRLKNQGDETVEMLRIELKTEPDKNKRE